MKNLLKILLSVLSLWQLNAQELSVPVTMGTQHPRVFGKEMSVEKLKKLADQQPWAQDIIDKTIQRVEPFI